jgi:hypothetical protein
MTPTLESTPSSTPDLTVLPTDDNHRGNGKVARLPKVLRDQVNRMLDDGFSYKAIIEKLEQSADPPLPYKLLEMNISRWKDNGYQHYLRHQEWRDDLRILRESGSEMNEFADGSKFQETLVQIALTEIFRVLQQRELKSDSLNFIRLFNSLARLNREALGLRKCNDLLAKQETELKKLDINRKFSGNEQRAIVDQADQIFRMPRPGPASIEPCSSRREEAQTNDRLAPSDSRNTSAPPIENRNSKIKNSPFPSTPDPRPSCAPPSNNPPIHQSNNPPAEHCLDCASPLPPVPPDAPRRPEDYCPSCGIRLPDIGLCEQPGFDHCLNCGAKQPALLPSGERPRPNCHKCGERLHNPEIPA